MTQTNPVTMCCHDIMLAANDTGLLNELVTFLKELKANYSFDFLQRAQRGVRGKVSILRIWSMHSSKVDSETNLYHLNFQLDWQCPPLMMIVRDMTDESGTTVFTDKEPFDL